MASDYHLNMLSADMESLSSEGGADFYCRNCSSKLTRSPIRLGMYAESTWLAKDV